MATSCLAWTVLKYFNLELLVVKVLGSHVLMAIFGQNISLSHMKL